MVTPRNGRSSSGCQVPTYESGDCDVRTEWLGSTYFADWFKDPDGNILSIPES